MTRAERARECFLNGHNCAQSVVMAFADDVDVAEETLLAASLPLGGGLGRLKTLGNLSLAHLSDDGKCVIVLMDLNLILFNALFRLNL